MPVNESIPSSPSVERDAEFLRAFLTDRDAPCPVCGYNLRNQLSDRCPECGDQVTLRVNAVEPRQAALIAGLIALASGAGLNGLLLIYWFFEIFRRRMLGNVVDRFFWVNAIGLVVEGVAITMWIAQWNRIRRLGTVRRWLLALAFCSFLTAADLIAFIRFIR